MMKPLLRTIALVVVTTASVPAQQPARAPWPSFRGPHASGVAAFAEPPLSWNVATARNVAWRTSIPGLGHSSPIVWGDRIYLTTAVSKAAAAQALTLGDSDAAGIDPAADSVPHAWQLMSIDRTTGKVVWTRTVHHGVPRVKRHVKGSHASATPATDGQVIVAMLGSEGLVAFDTEGKELWRKDFGPLAVGLADDPEFEWGPASSPVIYGDTVVVQNDRYKDSFVVALDRLTGKELWRASREERPSWTTPLVHVHQGRATLVVVSPLCVRGHDLRTGRELWRIEDPDGEVKVSTPVAAGDLAIVTGGWPSAARPVVAVRASDGVVRWRHDRGSPYTTTPLVYDGLLYIVTDNGILSAYDVTTGARAYQTRLSQRAGSFSASPVAAAGRIYFAGEDGQVIVVRAGRTFEVLATNEMNEVCMATPALSGNLLIVRTKTQLFALRNQPAS
jgi:outer membrane protein assembly factor BamB